MMTVIKSRREVKAFFSDYVEWEILMIFIIKFRFCELKALKIFALKLVEWEFKVHRR